MHDLLAPGEGQAAEALCGERVEELPRPVELRLGQAGERLLRDRRDAEVRRAASEEAARVGVALERRRERVAQAGERGALDLAQDDGDGHAAPL